MDSIRRSLGEEQISFFGWGYGSELGGTWATMFPTTVRAAVFDGALDPNADDLQEALHQVESFEDTLTTYLAQCSADPGCAFHNDGDAEGSFDELMLQLDATPIPSVEGRPEITRGVALTAVAQAMYGDDLWPELSSALSSAQSGRGAGLLRLYDSYFGYNGDGTWGNSLEAFQTIHCMDIDERLSVEQDDATAPMFTEVAPARRPWQDRQLLLHVLPRVNRSASRHHRSRCRSDPALRYDRQRRHTATGHTPMADTTEDSHLIVVDAISAGCLGVSQCADDLITDYLVDLDLPTAAETDCPAE